jgi:hypothetical protein
VFFVMVSTIVVFGCVLCHGVPLHLIILYQVHHGPPSSITLDGHAGVRRGLGYLPTDPETIDPEDESARVYQVHVFWQGQPIEGSPFEVDSLA